MENAPLPPLEIPAPALSVAEELPRSQKIQISRAVNELRTVGNKLILDLTTYKDYLLTDSANQKSVKTQIDEASVDIKTKWDAVKTASADISEFHDEVFSGEGDEVSIEQGIRDASAEFDGILKSVEKAKKEFDEYYAKIFGIPDDAGKVVGGLKQEIESNKTELEQLRLDTKKRYDSLIEQIEGLLPGATSAGLAAVYENQKTSYDKPNKFWTGTFIVTIASMALYAILSLKPSVVIGATLTETLSRVIARLPFFIPAVWLAHFASKQQSQNKRLAQEYAHKESVAKSYIGDRKSVV